MKQSAWTPEIVTKKFCHGLQKAKGKKRDAPMETSILLKDFGEDKQLNQ